MTDSDVLVHNYGEGAEIFAHYATIKKQCAGDRECANRLNEDLKVRLRGRGAGAGITLGLLGVAASVYYGPALARETYIKGTANAPLIAEALTSLIAGDAYMGGPLGPMPGPSAVKTLSKKELRVFYKQMQKVSVTKLNAKA